MIGCRLGRSGKVREGASWFITDEGGYTSVATAVALIVSISLVFSVASAQWTISRSADIQPVADACAMAGQNTVSAYYTIAQVLDASVLSMGLAGMAVLGAGLIAAAIPGAQVVSAKAISAGAKILRARQRFAKSVVKGLSKLEKLLPAIIVANSASCVAANSGNGASLSGIALPFPLESKSSFATMESAVDPEEVASQSERLRDATQRVEQAKRKADEALRVAWQADCVDSPSCLCSRAASLAGLSGTQNPRAETPEAWNFGMPILRSRCYYAQRIAQETPKGCDIESVTDSLARLAFYEYALDEVNGAWYTSGPDGGVSVNIPHLACNSDEVRSTWLYTDARWPCTEEEERGRTLHSSLECPGAIGEQAGMDSVESVDTGSVCECDVCRMSVGDLSSVAAISTIATNGYEHYWQIIVDASERYQSAKNEQVEAEQEARRIAEEGSNAFEKALSQLGCPRPRVCPPGAWGCVSVVRRSKGTTVPSELTKAFLTPGELPSGVAVSAAALAPDDATNGNDVLSHFFDGLGGNGFAVSSLGNIAGLWGKLLVSYGNKYEGMQGSVNDYLGKMDGLFGGTVGSWLKERVVQVTGALGLEPADMRMRKPVLTNTANVLERAGIEPTGKLRSMVQALPDNGSPAEKARALGCWIWNEKVAGKELIAEIPIPGTDQSIPLEVELGEI